MEKILKFFKLPPKEDFHRIIFESEYFTWIDTRYENFNDNDIENYFDDNCIKFIWFILFLLISFCILIIFL